MLNLIKSLLYSLVSKVFPKKIGRFFLTCEDSAQLLSNKDQITFSRKVRLKFHIFICHCCSNFEKQINLIDEHSCEINKRTLTSEHNEKIKSSKESALNDILNNK